MSTEQRETGFYYVNYQGNWMVGEWSLADECWWLTGTDLPYGEPEFDEIDPTPIIRG